MQADDWKSAIKSQLSDKCSKNSHFRRVHRIFYRAVLIIRLVRRSTTRYRCRKAYQHLHSLILLFPSSDVDAANHKNTKLTIVEEGDLDTQTQSFLQVPDYDIPSSAASSAENLAANTRANQHSNFNHQHSSSRLNNIPEDESPTQRRPSLLMEMQEMVSGRRPSAVMASLRRGSQSILHAFRGGKHDDPNDHVGAKSPEAVESRRKNRRIGEWVRFHS